jgi:hypothetical protein
MADEDEEVVEGMEREEGDDEQHSDVRVFLSRSSERSDTGGEGQRRIIIVA